MGGFGGAIANLKMYSRCNGNVQQPAILLFSPSVLASFFYSSVSLAILGAFGEMLCLEEKPTSALRAATAQRCVLPVSFPVDLLL